MDSDGRKSTRLPAQNSGGSAGNRPRGRPFAKGRSGNPGGRPKDVGPVRDLARLYTAEAVGVLVGVMRRGENERARTAAAEALLDRGHGRPVAFDVRGYIEGQFARAIESLRERFEDRPEVLDEVIAAIAGGDDEATTDHLRAPAVQTIARR